ncbi:hypothetical protein F4824DRAFT_487867 [Ustulina deusta]|nr:hypothetical protein F4824DRAFT_487867 [Ustulina deusta]
MSTLRRCVPLRKQLEATNAIQQLQEGRPDRFPLQEVQAVISDLLRTRGIKQDDWQKIDKFLSDRLDQFKNELYAHEVAIVACCHVMSNERVRGQLISTRPLDELSQHIQWKLKSWIQCIFQCQRARSSLFTKVERAAIIQLLHAVVPAGSTRFQPIWKLLCAIGDGRVQELFPIAFVKKVLVYSDYWSRLSSELEALRSFKRWWTLVKGMRRAADSPQIQELLRQRLNNYSMWASWNPNIELINEWESPVLSNCRQQLAIILDLEGPDTTGGQHGTLRGACLYHDDSVQNRALQAASWAINIGKEGVNCLVEFCTSIEGLSEQSVVLLESILELDTPEKITEAGILFRFSREYMQIPSVSSRIPLLVSVLYAVQASHKLQQLLGEELMGRLHETLRDAQIKCYDQLQKGDPSNRVAFGIIKLARALISANWLTQYGSTEYNEMLSQIPSEGEVSRRLDRISRTEGRERQDDVEFLIEKLCAGPRASATAQSKLAEDVQLEDPVWTVPMDVDRERLRNILAGMEYVDRATATACVKRAQDEEDSFIQSLNTMIGVNTDQVCVNLARYLGRFATKPSNLDQCWKSLLLGMMRAKPNGLLDRLGEDLSLPSWQTWLNCLQHIFGESYLDPEGQLGFTKAKIRQWQLRKISLGRNDSGASTATRSTGGLSVDSSLTSHRSRFSRGGSLCEPGTPLTIPMLHELDGQNAWSATPRTGTLAAETSVGGSGDIPWYEREIELLNAIKRHVDLSEQASGKNWAGIIGEDEDIYN